MVERIVDEALICHVAWIDDEGRPRVLPTIQARVGDTLYLHGSRAARAWKAVAAGAEVCVVATIVDGLVLARSAFSHSMNYRSVVLYGRAREVTDPDELLVAARAITRHVLPGREDEARMPSGRRVPPDDPVRDPDRRGLREGPDRAADRRRGRPCGADLGGGPAARHGRRGARAGTRSHGMDRGSRLRAQPRTSLARLDTPVRSVVSICRFVISFRYIRCTSQVSLKQEGSVERCWNSGSWDC